MERAMRGSLTPTRIVLLPKGSTLPNNRPFPVEWAHPVFASFGRDSWLALAIALKAFSHLLKERSTVMIFSSILEAELGTCYKATDWDSFFLHSSENNALMEDQISHSSLILGDRQDPCEETRMYGFYGDLVERPLSVGSISSFSLSSSPYSALSSLLSSACLHALASHHQPYLISQAFEDEIIDSEDDDIKFFYSSD
ncbi:hypothetical protein LguiB_000651 [Lonicera macranthoides]